MRILEECMKSNTLKKESVEGIIQMVFGEFYTNSRRLGPFIEERGSWARHMLLSYCRINGFFEAGIVINGLFEANIVELFLAARFRFNRLKETISRLSLPKERDVPNVSDQAYRLAHSNDSLTVADTREMIPIIKQAYSEQSESWPTAGVVFLGCATALGMGIPTRTATYAKQLNEYLKKATTVMEKKIGYRPNEMQLLSVLLMIRNYKRRSQNGNLYEIATGEGKSLIIAILAGYLVQVGKQKVDLVLTSKELTKKFKEMDPFFRGLGISSKSVEEGYNADVSFGPVETFITDVLCEKRNDRSFECLILDEADKLVIDDFGKEHVISQVSKV